MFETRLVIEVVLSPYPKMAVSVPYPAAAREFRPVPTPVVSVETIPVLLTKLVIDTVPEALVPYPKMALSVT